MGLMSNNGHGMAAPPQEHRPRPSQEEAEQQRGVDNGIQIPNPRKPQDDPINSQSSNGIPNTIRFDVGAFLSDQVGSTVSNITNPTASQVITTMPEEFMPQAMPTTRNIPERPQRPGAYRGSQATGTTELERTHSLYKGGLHVLGREGETDDPPSIQFGLSDRRIVHSMPQVDEPTTERDIEDPLPPAVVHVHPNEWDVQQECQSKKDLVKDDPSKKKNRQQYYKWIAMAVAGVILLIVAVVVGVVVGMKGSDEEPAMESTNQGSGGPESLSSQSLLQQLDQVFENPRDVLLPDTIVQIQFGKAGNPQLQAFQWLLQDPKLNQYSIEQKRQRLALASLYYATNGPNWFDNETIIPNPWLDYSLHECEWYSLAQTQQQQPCYNYTSLTKYRETHIDYRSLVLSGNEEYTKNNARVNPQMRGTLVPELGMLTKLSSLDLGHQKLKGSIPTELAELSATLQHIVLEEGSFTGSIPDALYEFPRVLRLSRNEGLQEGFIPTTVGKNPRLTHLALINTNRRGTAPPELFSKGILQQLLLNQNEMTGVLPTQIGLVAASLIEINLTVNRFTGNIPSQVGLLGQLELFLVGANKFSGLTPTEIGNIGESLQQIEVKKNRFEGLIPSEIGRLTNLNHLDLGENNYRGVLPTSLSQLSELTWLNVINNRIEGALRPELVSIGNETRSAWPKLENLVLATNRMTGTLPSEIGLLTSLTRLNLRDNDFESTLPTELGLLSSLKAVLMEGTNLSGAVPEEVCSLPLQTLNVECANMACPSSCDRCNC